MSWYRKIVTSNFQGSTVYHGCSKADAESIKNTGIDISMSHGGYFGWAFYTTPDKNLAQSHYADFAEEEDYEDIKGAVLEFKVSSNANILDLRKEEDFQKYLRTNHSNLMHTPEGSQKIYTNHGIDAIYDNSNDSLMIFNPNILTLVGEDELV